MEFKACVNATGPVVWGGVVCGEIGRNDQVMNGSISFHS